MTWLTGSGPASTDLGEGVGAAAEPDCATEQGDVVRLRGTPDRPAEPLGGGGRVRRLDGDHHGAAARGQDRVTERLQLGPRSEIEATASIDPTSERLVQQALAALAADCTVIVAAHRLATVSGADQILVMDAGRIVERGRHDHLLDAGGPLPPPLGPPPPCGGAAGDGVSARQLAAVGERVHRTDIGIGYAVGDPSSPDWCRFDALNDADLVRRWVDDQLPILGPRDVTGAHLGH